MSWLYACIHLDRQILSALTESVKSDLHLQDRDLGALTGSAFSIVYALLGLYFGALADRRERLSLVRAGAWIWSLACIGAAFAQNYPMLIASRAGVAVGEAVATPAAVSLIAELAGERYRARLASLFLTSAFVGAGCAAVLGGAIVGFMHRVGASGGWRAALIAAGLPGLAGALYLRFLRGFDTRRPAPIAAGNRVAAVLLGGGISAIFLQMYCAPTVSVPLSVLCALLIAIWWGYMLRRADPAAYRATLGQSSFRYIVLAFAAVLFVDSASSFWLIPYAQRHFRVDALTAGTLLGGLMIAGGVVGCLLGGWIADRWHEVQASGRAWTALLAVVTEAGAILMALAQSDYRAFLFAWAVFCVCSGGWVGVAAALAFDAVPRAHRGTGTSVYFVFTTLLGPALGPFVVGWSADSLGSVGTALSWTCGLMLLGAAALARLGHSQMGVPHSAPGQ